MLYRRQSLIQGLDSNLNLLEITGVSLVTNPLLEIRRSFSTHQTPFAPILLDVLLTAEPGL